MLIDKLEDILFDDKYDELTQILSTIEATECNFEIFKKIIDCFNDNALEILLKSKLDVNCKNDCGVTPFLYASCFVSEATLSKLLYYGSDLYVKDDCGETALIKAAKNDNVDVLQFLIDKGLHIDEPNNFGNTPLMFAAQHEKLEALETLIKLGADLTPKNVMGDTVLSVASRCNEEFEMAEKLIQAGANPNVHEYEYGRVPLSDFLRTPASPIHIVDLLIKNGADVNYSDKGGSTPLFVAVLLGRCDVVKLLLTAGANIQTTNPLGITLAELAKKLKYNDIAALLSQ